MSDLIWEPGDRVIYSRAEDKAFYGKVATVITHEEFTEARGHTPNEDTLVCVRFEGDNTPYGAAIWSTSPDTICPAFDSITKIEEFLK